MSRPLHTNMFILNALKSKMNIDIVNETRGNCEVGVYALGCYFKNTGTC